MQSNLFVWRAQMPLKEAYVISRYIENPLLFNKRKFDIRVFALLTYHSNFLLHNFAANWIYVFKCWYTFEVHLLHFIIYTITKP